MRLTLDQALRLTHLFVGLPCAKVLCPSLDQPPFGDNYVSILSKALRGPRFHTPPRRLERRALLLNILQDPTSRDIFAVAVMNLKQFSMELQFLLLPGWC